MFERITVKAPIRFRNPADDREGSGETMDISANGIGFITEEKLLIDTKLEIYINLTHHKSSIPAHGKVVWVSPSEEKQQRTGVCIEEQDLVNVAQQVLYDSEPKNLLTKYKI